MNRMISLVGRVMDGTRVNGYIVKDSLTGKLAYMSKSDVEIWALNKRVSNCSAQKCKGTVNLKGIGHKLSELPKYTSSGKPCNKDLDSRDEYRVPEFELRTRVINGKYNVGCIVYVYRTKEERFMSKEEVIHYAEQGLIRDVKVARNGDKVILRGISRSLDTLPAKTPREIYLH